MSDLPEPDPPTPTDRRRRRMARISARRAVVAARAECGRASMRAFRAELAATVRSASPLLVTLLRTEGLTLDEVMAHLVPAPGWPARPRLSASDTDAHALRWSRRPAGGLRVFEHPHGLRLPLTCGAVVHVHVLGHSLEVEIGTPKATLRTRFGLLRIVVPGTLPETVAATILGSPVDGVVDHPLLHGWDWRVAGVEAGGENFRIVCRIGTLSYRWP